MTIHLLQEEGRRQTIAAKQLKEGKVYQRVDRSLVIRCGEYITVINPQNMHFIQHIINVGSYAYIEVDIEIRVLIK